MRLANIPLTALLTLALAAPADAQTPLRLTNADLPLLREYLAVDVAAVEREMKRQQSVLAASDRETASFEAARDARRRKIRSGELDQLALLHEGSTGLLVPDGTEYDAACSRQHDVDPGHAVFKGPRTGGGAAGEAQVEAWIRWYASRGYSSGDSYRRGVTLIGPARRQKEPREVNISISLVDEACGDTEPRVHVDGWHGESDRNLAALQRLDDEMKAADTLDVLATAEETLTARGLDPASYVARREALTSAYLSRQFSDVEWAVMADGERAEVKAELAARRANVAWLLDVGKELLPLLRRYLGS